MKRIVVREGKYCKNSRMRRMKLSVFIVVIEFELNHKKIDKKEQISEGKINKYIFSFAKGTTFLL